MDIRSSKTNKRAKTGKLANGFYAMTFVLLIGFWAWSYVRADEIGFWKGWSHGSLITTNGKLSLSLIIFYDSHNYESVLRYEHYSSSTDFRPHAVAGDRASIVFQIGSFAIIHRRSSKGEVWGYVFPYWMLCCALCFCVTLKVFWRRPSKCHGFCPFHGKALVDLDKFNLK